MPKLFDDVLLLEDCPGDALQQHSLAPINVPRGSRGVLVHQNEAYPSLWTIECVVSGVAGPVLVEVSEDKFTVCASDDGAERGP
jgi:hypothetical protein